MLAPFSPHISEELWHLLGSNESVHLQNWPEYDPKAIILNSYELVIQINGKVRDKKRGVRKQMSKDREPARIQKR